MIASKRDLSADLSQRATAIAVGIVWASTIVIALLMRSAPWSGAFAVISSLTCLALLLMVAFRPSLIRARERHFNLISGLVLFIILMPSTSELFIHAQNTRTIGDRSEVSGPDACRRGELVVPNGQNLVASIRRTACAPPFDPDDIDYYIFVHEAGARDSASNLVLHYKADNYGPWPVLSPRVFWSGKFRLHVALPMAPETIIQLAQLGGIRVSYDFWPHFERRIVAMRAPTRSRGAHLLKIPLWGRLRVGMRVHFAEDPYGTAETLTVCPNAASYYEATIQPRAGCMHKQHGTEAIVTAVIPSRLSDWYYPAPLARIRAQHGNWQGVTTVLGLQPDIHPGDIITMTKKEFRVQLHHCPDHCADLNNDPTLELTGKARVRVLQYDPVSRAFDSLYVQVIDGPYVGQRGWTAMSYAQSADSLYSNMYGLDYSPVPELEPDYVNH